VPRQKKPFVVQKRKDWKTYIITLNDTSGLPAKICNEWQRKSFQNFPLELISYSSPKTKAVAEAGATALIAFLKDPCAATAKKNDYSVGEWLRLFTSITESPKGARNVAENNPYSEQSVGHAR